MRTSPPALSSRLWVARIGLVLALGMSEVVVAAVAGIGGWRLVALAVLTAAFVLGYLVTPSAGKHEYEQEARRPVAVMAVASVAAIVLTGAGASPLTPILAAPYMLALSMFRPRRVDVIVGLVPVAAVVSLWFATDALDVLAPANPLLLGAWTTGLVLWIVGRRTAQMFETLRDKHGCLSRVREGALVDAAGRRRGLESLTTKLAHELKNPLAAIKALVQVELHHAQDDRARRRLDVVLTETERIRSILGEYLEHARPIEDLDLRPVALDELMAEITALVDGRAEAAGVALEISAGGEVIVADRRRLKEAIVNLICNGIEATPRGGSVTVRCELAGQLATIAVQDTGAGMSAEVANRVGTPFFTTRADGTGLGVAIARATIAQHHGRLDFASAPGRGTTATIALPVDPARQLDAAA